MGIYNLGPPIGAALGIAFGASIAAAFNWRDAFIAIGVVGLIAAVAVRLIVREPRRGGLDARAVSAEASKSGLLASRWMFFSRPTLVLAALGSGATQFITYGAGNFTTLFLMREKGMTLQQVAIWYALVVGIGMSAGMLISGRVIDRFDAPLEGGLCPGARGVARRSRCPSISASSGRRPGRSRCSSCSAR